MSWRWLIARYVWIVALREALRSSRWSGGQKAVAITAVGFLMSIPTLLSYAVWVLTGRTFMGWWFRHDVSVVNPFPRGLPFDLREVQP